MSPRPSVAHKGLTLVELLITIAIIGVLAAMILPYIGRYSREAARRATCLNNVKNVVLACVNYESTNSLFPPVIGKDGESFLVRILPMLDSSPHFDDFRSGTNKTNEINKLAKVEREIFRCASAASSDFQATENGSFTSHYAGLRGIDQASLND